MAQITPESFNILLQWLDPDRDEAGRKYEVIRRALVRIFISRGCAEPENLADITIDRVAVRVDQIRATYVGNPAYYFRGVAYKIFLEYLKNRREAPLEDVPEPVDEVPQQYGLDYECLTKCLDSLSPANKDLILDYYLDDRSAKIDRRKALADELGVAPNTLRLRAHRIRNTLEGCVRKCMGK